jgi:hypothetical protein
VTQVKPDRPLIAAVVFLAAGLWLLFAYCTGNVGASAGDAWSAVTLKICTTTSGVPALAGTILALAGVLLLLLSFVCAVVAQFRGKPQPAPVD